MSVEPHRRVNGRAADSPDEASGIIMMLGLLAILCVLAILFI